MSCDLKFACGYRARSLLAKVVAHLAGPFARQWVLRAAAPTLSFTRTFFHYNSLTPTLHSPTAHTTRRTCTHIHTHMGRRAQQIAKAFQMFVYMYAEMELAMDSVDRVAVYQRLTPEAPYTTEEQQLDLLAQEEDLEDAAGRVVVEGSNDDSERPRGGSGGVGVVVADAGGRRSGRRENSSMDTKRGRADVSSSGEKGDKVVEMTPRTRKEEEADRAAGDSVGVAAPTVVDGVTIGVAVVESNREDLVQQARKAMAKPRRVPKRLLRTAKGRALLTARIADAEAALESWPHNGVRLCARLAAGALC